MSDPINDTIAQLRALAPNYRTVTTYHHAESILNESGLVNRYKGDWPKVKRMLECAFPNLAPW